MAEEVGYVFYIDPGTGARHQHGLLGTAGQGRPGAARAQRRHGRVHQRREPALHLDQEKNKLPLVYTYVQETGISIPIPMPPITPLNPPLGAFRRRTPTCFRRILKPSATTCRSCPSRRPS
jgi:hypothetical protein